MLHNRFRLFLFCIYFIAGSMNFVECITPVEKKIFIDEENPKEKMQVEEGND